MLIFALAMPSVLGQIATIYTTQFASDADIVIRNEPSSGNRFFALPSLRNDQVLAQNSEYIHGFFMSYAQIQGQVGLVFAANFAELQQYNPIRAQNLPTHLENNEVIVSTRFALANRLSLNSSVSIRFAGITQEFTVRALAHDEGLLYFGSAFIASSALSRFGFGTFTSGLITHALIKYQNHAAGEVILNRLAQYHPGLTATQAADSFAIGQTLHNATVTVAYTSIMVVLFCILTLIVLMRFMFERDRKNFVLFAQMGMRRRKILSMVALSVSVVVAFGLLLAFGTAALSMLVIQGVSPLFSGVSIGFLPYLIGISGGAILAFTGAIFGIRSAQNRTLKAQKSTPRMLFLGGVFIASLALAVTAAIASGVPALRYLTLSSGIFGLVGLVITLPKILSFVFKYFYKARPNIYTLRLKSLNQTASWRKYAVFVMVGVLATMLLLLSVAQLNSFMTRAVSEDIGANIENLTGVSAINLMSYIVSLFADFMWIVMLFFVALIALTAVTMVLMAVVRRMSSRQEVSRLALMGLTRKANVRQNAFMIAVALLSLMLILPFLTLVLNSVKHSITAIANVTSYVYFDWVTVITGVIAFFVIILAIEVVSSSREMARKKI